MQFNANINVNFLAQPELLEALGNIGTFLETLVFIRENEKATSPNTVPDALQKAHANKVMRKATEAPQTGAQEAEEPKAEEAKAENPEIKVEGPAESEADPKEKVSGAKLIELRGAVSSVISKDPKNRQHLKEWLHEHGLGRVTECTISQSDELIEYLKGLGGGEDA